MFGRKLTDKKIKQIHDSVTNASDSEEAIELLKPLIEAQATNQIAADALIDIILNRYLTIDKSLELLSEIYEAHKDNDDIVILLGSAMEAGRDIDYLNDPPPEHPLFGQIINHLSEMSLACNDKDKEALIVEGLSCTARLVARQYDSVAERSYARLVELMPSTPWAHYNQGLFFKTRGHFSEGVVCTGQLKPDTFFREFS